VDKGKEGSSDMDVRTFAAKKFEILEFMVCPLEQRRLSQCEHDDLISNQLRFVHLNEMKITQVLGHLENVC